MLYTVCCRGDGIYRSILSWAQQIIGGSYLCLFSVRLYKHSYCIINIRVKPVLFLYIYCSHPQDNSCITALQREFIPRTSIHWRLAFYFTNTYSRITASGLSLEVEFQEPYNFRLGKKIFFHNVQQNHTCAYII